MAGQTQSELTVVMKAKDLCSYVITVTQKSPKQFRFTFVSRMQNLALDVIENIYRANDTFVTENNKRESMPKRLDFQHAALTSVKLLAYFASVALEQQCILAKQFEQISKQVLDCQRLLGAWINADKRRFGA